MATAIYLTEYFTLVTADSMRQPLWKALDVMAYDVIDLIVVASFDQPTAGTMNIYITTGMQRQSATGQAPIGWVNLSPALPVNASNPVQRTTLSSANGLGFMRYIGWQSSGQGGVGSRFMIYGTGRKFGDR